MPPIQVNLNLVDALLFVGAGVLLIYDRFTLVKKHDEIIKKLEKVIGNLDIKFQALDVSLTALTAEFHTYRELKNGH